MTVRRALGVVLLGTSLASALTGCSTTLDSLGADASSIGGDGGSGGGSAGGAGSPGSAGSIYTALRPVKALRTDYPSAFAEFGMDPNGDLSAKKLEAAFKQLFHPVPDDGTQAIYNEQGNHDGQPEAVIHDVLHDDIRTEGIGLAMLITVELNKRTEFDRLWRYAKFERQVSSGPAQGYFDSSCGEDTATDCYDSYGMQHFVLALMFASRRWSDPPADLPYASDALTLLDLLQNKEAANGGIVMGIGSAFDAKTHLVREEPTLADAGYTTRTALEMPAAYWYWGEATGNPFWSAAATAARAHLLAAAHPTTGLWPMRSYFDGTPVGDSPEFTAQAYRTHLNLAIDALWATASDDQAALASKVLAFFHGEGLSTYATAYTTDGQALDTKRAQALIAANGALTVAALPSDANRKEFVDAVWQQAIPSGDNRYYDGLFYLMSLLILSGQLKVY